MGGGNLRNIGSTYKTPRRAYPFEVVIINQIAILNEENGKTALLNQGMK
jgi:hypothetical protein